MLPKRTDLEIYEIAQIVLSKITEKLYETYYKKLGGSLTLGWSHGIEFNAWAESHTILGEAPNHKIILNYELARQLYRDAEGFCEYAQSEPVSNLIKNTFKNHPYDCLPACFTSESCINNMFLSALTWVYYHEFGHLIQEHGMVRANTIGNAKKHTIEEMHSNAKVTLTGRAASISHATELAADYEATTLCVFSSALHFLKSHSKPSDAEIFTGNIYLLTCSLACIFYRFNGGSLGKVSTPITGSHPSAIYRIEIIAPHIYELADRLLKEYGFEMTDGQLISIVKQAADLGSLYYNYSVTAASEKTIDLFIKGMSNRPEFKPYSREIVNIWDEIYPTINTSRKFGIEAGLMKLTDAFRQFSFNE
jgi:hypothetical protein